MAAPRRISDLVIGHKELLALKSIARSRSDPAGRGARARMLMAYRKDPAFFARVTVDRVRGSIADLEALDAGTAAPTDFVDLSETGEFAPEILDGECSACTDSPGAKVPGCQGALVRWVSVSSNLYASICVDDSRLI